MADSFVGRWFSLEGSGAKKEREGSRFIVRGFFILLSDFSCSLQFVWTTDRDSCWSHDMGAYSVFNVLFLLLTV